tara:strand:+ start:16492 stop:16941 length:450 start_codon:yes stop_codon:yes gene_type:complete
MSLKKKLSTTLETLLITGSAVLSLQGCATQQSDIKRILNEIKPSKIAVVSSNTISEETRRKFQGTDVTYLKLDQGDVLAYLLPGPKQTDSFFDAVFHYGDASKENLQDLEALERAYHTHGNPLEAYIVEGGKVTEIDCHEGHPCKPYKQ